MTGAPRVGGCARRPWRLPGRAAAIGGRDVAAVAADLGPIEIHLRHIRRCEKGAARGGGAPLSALGPHLGLARSGQRRGRVVRLPVKIAPASAMADDGGVSDVVSLSRHRHCSPRHPSWTAPGETLDLGLPDRTMTALSGSFSLLGASFWSRCWMGRARRGGVLRHLTRRRRRVLAARRSGVSALDV